MEDALYSWAHREGRGAALAEKGLSFFCSAEALQLQRKAMDQKIRKVIYVTTHEGEEWDRQWVLGRFRKGLMRQAFESKYKTEFARWANGENQYYSEEAFRRFLLMETTRAEKGRERWVFEGDGDGEDFIHILWVIAKQVLFEEKRRCAMGAPGSKEFRKERRKNN